MNRRSHPTHRAPAFTGAALATAAWDASPADIDALAAHVQADEPTAAAASARGCATLPATTSAWLDGLLCAHRPLRC